MPSRRSGGIAVTGLFKGTTDFGGGPLESAGREDVVVAKYDAAGKHLFSKRLGGSEHDKGAGVAVDGAGTVLVTGRLVGKAELAGGPALTSAGEADVFLASFGP